MTRSSVRQASARRHLTLTRQRAALTDHRGCAAPEAFLNPPIIEAVLSGQRKVVAPLISTDKTDILAALVRGCPTGFGVCIQLRLGAGLGVRVERKLDIASGLMLSQF